MRIVHVYNEAQLKDAVQKSRSLAEVLKILNIPVHGSNYKTLNNRLKMWNIDNSHFTGMSWSRGKVFPSKISTDEYLSNRKKINTHNLKLRLIKDGFFKHKCYSCNLITWKDSPIPIELHHIDGNRLNNNLDNLQILCPNCHAQTDNYCGKKIKNKNRKRGKGKPYSKQNFCNCGSKILPKSTQCYICYRNSQSQNLPTKEELILELQKHKTVLSIAKFYHVSDNTIRKWCRKYSIDYKSLLA